jgi:predicted GIY-YIG superfamily endonuclease
VTRDFLNKLSGFEADLKNHSDKLLLQKEPDYPDTANSNAWLIGKARYKDMNEALAREYEEKYWNTYKKIDFNRVNFVARSEIEMVIAQLRHYLCRTPA